VFSYRHFNTTPTETTETIEIKTSDQHKFRQKNETKTILVWNAAERAEV
jgi:hypothetical protein